MGRGKGEAGGKQISWKICKRRSTVASAREEIQDRGNPSDWGLVRDRPCEEVTGKVTGPQIRRNWLCKEGRGQGEHSSHGEQAVQRPCHGRQLVVW